MMKSALMHGYQILRLDRNRNGGGVLMFIHTSLIYKHLSISSDGLELLSISVSSNHSSGKHCISVLYRPPLLQLVFLIICILLSKSYLPIVILVLYSLVTLILIFVTKIILINFL